MDVGFWIAAFAVTSLFCTWVIFLGGADWLEGSWLAEVLITRLAGEVSAAGLKVLAGIIWFGQAIFLLIRLLN